MGEKRRGPLVSQINILSLVFFVTFDIAALSVEFFFCQTLSSFVLALFRSLCLAHRYLSEPFPFEMSTETLGYVVLFFPPRILFTSP